MAEAVAVHGAGVSDEHRVSGSRESGGGSSVWGHCWVLALVAPHVGHYYGPHYPASLGPSRRRHWETLS